MGIEPLEGQEMHDPYAIALRVNALIALAMAADPVVWHAADEVEGRAALARKPAPGERCVVCGQVDRGQRGRFACPACGLPMVEEEEEESIGHGGDRQP